MPTIHPYLKIAASHVNGHTKEFATASASSEADQMLIKGAVVLAKVGYDLLTEPALRKAALKEFREKAPQQR